MDTATPGTASANARPGNAQRSPAASVDLTIGGMTCVACAARIEKVLNRLPAVKATVNFASERAHVEYDPAQTDPAALTAAVVRTGYAATLVDDSPAAGAQADAARSQAHLASGRALLASALLTAPLLAQMAGMFAGRHDWMIPAWIQFVLASVVQFGFGRPFYRGAWNSLRGGGANMDVLVVLGTTIAWAYSTAVTFFAPDQHLYFESSAAIITLVMLGKWLEAGARARTGAAIASLIALQPPTARVERASADGSVQTAEIPVADVHPGMTLLMRPGESFPVDGVVLDGHSTVDEAMLTGESLPVGKSAGDTVFAGTLNGNGVLRMRATGVGASTSLARIVRLVSEAQGSKAPIQRLADRIAGVFVPSVLAISVMTFAAWLIAGHDLSSSLIPAIAVLVIACPCALGLATPTAVIVGIGQGSRAGILIRNAGALERAQRIDTLIVDKTGTLTTGHPAVVAIVPFAGTTEAELLATAAALEADSEHPLAAALRGAAIARPELPSIKATDFLAVTGHGICARIDGRPALLGSPDWVDAQGGQRPAQARWPAEDSRTWIGVALDGRALGAIALADPLRADTRAAVAQLRAAGVELVVMSGDNPSVTARIASEAGIAVHHGRCLPEDKAARIRQLQAQGRVVGMVGDGINDAPALAAADVSFAIGSGAGIALQTADITLMASRLSQVVDAIDLSRATMAKIRQNLFLAFGYNVLGIPLAAAGMLNPVIAGAAMAASSVCVISNALLLHRWRPQPSSSGAALPAAQASDQPA